MVSGEPAIGIDLGTTFSVIAHIDSFGRPCTILNSDGDATLPSVVMFDSQTVVVGKEALRAAAQEPEQVIRFVKREIGNQYCSKLINGQRWSPEMIQSFILKRLKEDAERVVGPIRRAVITVPAYFNDPRRLATQNAGRLADLEVLDIINEPTAAALAYCHLRDQAAAPGDRERILVFDLGGGTFDVTLVEFQDGQLRTLATDGEVTLGGCDWDRRIVDHVAREYSATNRGQDPTTDPAMLQKLMLQAEDVKRSLSQKNEAKIFLDHPFQFRSVLTRAKLEEITEDLVERTRWTTERVVLEHAKLQWADINTVLLVGGSGRMPMIKRMLEQLTGQPVVETVSKDEAIAWGAALYARSLMDADGPSTNKAGSPPLQIQDVNSHALGVPVKDRTTGEVRFSVLIPANTPLPAEVTREYKLSKPNARINVTIFEGADPQCQYGKIGAVECRPQQPWDAGEPARVTFRYERNGRLRVLIARPRTGENWEGEIGRAAT